MSTSRVRIGLLIGFIVVALVSTVVAAQVLTTTQTQAEADTVASPHPTPVVLGPAYKWYTPETLAQAQTQGRTFLLFWVPWCSSCSALDVELEQRSGELPANVTVLKINMDHDKTLATKYGVTIQHTVVEVDAQGNEIQKWVGGDFNAFTTHL